MCGLLLRSQMEALKLRVLDVGWATVDGLAHE